MECPNCAATLPDDNVFCEECGVRLMVCACGAAPDEVDEDGFCGRCGKRVRPRPEDHIEIVISPDFAAVSDRGIRHDRNEDRVGISKRWHRLSACAELNEDAQAESLRHLIVICDGVSSSSDAQTAASVAVEAISEAIQRNASMQDAFTEAAQRVAAIPQGPWGDPPSTTAVAAVIHDRSAEIAWVGDSRCYWVDASGARQLTRDHSWLNDALASGEITFEEAASSPNAHAITRWLGGEAGENARPETVQFEVPGPGALLLCTDGLWNYAPAEEDIANLLRDGSGDALDVCRSLIEFAKQRGGQDNITAALLRFRGIEKEDGERIPG
jgi:serine/threonine protein phosphatase PrpC